MLLAALRCSWVLLLLTILPMASGPALASESGYQALLDSSYPADGPGATALVMRDGEVLFRGARGQADLELGTPLRPEHVFRIGSITKQFTGVAIMQMVEQGKLSLDDEITRFLPEYPTQGHSITVAHLLNHTSGVFSYTQMTDHMQGPGIRAVVVLLLSTPKHNALFLYSWLSSRTVDHNSCPSENLQVAHQRIVKCH
ncbi:MAG: serine hydrolase domain-containing protein [Acidobacteriota bacterium]